MMPLTAMEVAMQTIGSVMYSYAKKEEDDIKLTEQGLCRLVHQQCQVFSRPQEEPCPEVYKLRIPLNKVIQESGSLTDELPDVNCMNSKMYLKGDKLVINSRFK